MNAPLNYIYLSLRKLVDSETTTELRLEPCGLRRHYIARICDIYELLHRNWIEGESYLHLAVVNSA